MSLKISTCDLDVASSLQPGPKGCNADGTDSGYSSAVGNPPHRDFHNLSQSELELSTGRFFRRKITKLRVFDQDIPPHVQNRFIDLQELFERPLYERLVSSGRSFGPLSMRLKVLGASEETSAYWVVIQCDISAERRIKQFFEQAHVKLEFQPQKALTDMPVFKTWVCPRPPRQLAREYSTNLYGIQNAEDRTLCGRLVQVEGRVATLGGAIMVKVSGEEPALYCLTAGHIIESTATGSDASILDQVDKELDKEWGDDPFEEVFELDSALGGDEKVEGVLPSCFEFTELAMNCHWLKLGRTKLTKDTSPRTKHCLDWALAELEDPALYRPNEFALRANYHGDLELTETARRSIMLQEGRWVIVLSGVSGLKHGKLSATPSFFMDGPATSFTHMYTLTIVDGSSLQVGDCGSWIIDEATLEVYGHVIASDMFGEVYIAPLKDTLKQVEEMLEATSVSLPTRSEVFTWVDCRTKRRAAESRARTMEDVRRVLGVGEKLIGTTSLFYKAPAYKKARKKRQPPDEGKEALSGANVENRLQTEKPRSGYDSDDTPYNHSNNSSAGDLRELPIRFGYDSGYASYNSSKTSSANNSRKFKEHPARR